MPFLTTVVDVEHPFQVKLQQGPVGYTFITSDKCSVLPKTKNELKKEWDTQHTEHEYTPHIALCAM